MRRMALLSALAAAGCGNPAALPPEPREPGEEMTTFAARLLRTPGDAEALRGLVSAMMESDAYVMSVMRRHHGTAAHVMTHYYPSHRWAHPFVRGYILAQQGKETAAREEFWSAVEAASDYVATRECFGDGELLQVAGVVVQESRRFLASR